MATATETRNEGRSRTDISDDDRRLLSGWDRRDAWEDWFDAALTVQRDYLDFVNKTFKMLMPYHTN